MSSHKLENSMPLITAIILIIWTYKNINADLNILKWKKLSSDGLGIYVFPVRFLHSHGPRNNTACEFKKDAIHFC